MVIAKHFATCFIALASAAAFPQRGVPLYKNPGAPIPNRVRDLLGRMTLEEKVAQLQSGVRMPQMAHPAGLFEKDHLNEPSAKELLGDGLGSYAFLDEFSGFSAGPREGAMSLETIRRSTHSASV